MKLKMMIFVLIMASCFYCNGMENSDEEQAEITSSLSNNWEIVPDELALYIISFAVRCKTFQDAFSTLGSIKSLDKKFKRLSDDESIFKLLVVLYINDDDYQIFLNKMLFSAACTGNIHLIELLKKFPSNASEQKIIHITDEQAFDLSEVKIESKMREMTECDRVTLVSESVNHQQTNFLEANINNIDEFGYTPILHAAERGHIKVFQALLAHNALIVLKNKDGDTALIMAARGGFLKIVKKLLFLEAARKDINVRGFGKDTAFLTAAKECLYTCDEAKENNYLAILKLLASCGADVNALDAADLSAMDQATKKGKINLINVLLDLDAHFTKQNKAGIDVYLLAMIKDEEVMQLLEKIEALEINTKVIEVAFNLMAEPYWLSFKIDEEEYKTELENENINKMFAEKIDGLDNNLCTQIGNAIVQKVYLTGVNPNSITKNNSDDANDYRLAFMLLFGELLYESYYIAKECNNEKVMKKIREIVKAIFKAYPEKNSSIYRYGLEDYEV